MDFSMFFEGMLQALPGIAVGVISVVITKLYHDIIKSVYPIWLTIIMDALASLSCAYTGYKFISYIL